jgi:membrane protein
VAGVIKNATAPSSGLLASTISLLVLFYGASGVFTQMFDTFNEIWSVPVESRSGFRFNIRKRLIGVLMVLVAGILLLGTLALGSVIAYLNGLMNGQFPRLTTWLNLADRGLSFVLMPLLLSLMFWFFPAVKVRWSEMLPAALLTSALFAASRYLTNFYLQFSSTSEIYGAAGSLVVLLVWVYITGLVVFFGASFSCAWSRSFGEAVDDAGVSTESSERAPLSQVASDSRSDANFPLEENVASHVLPFRRFPPNPDSHESLTPQRRTGA